MVIMDLDGIPLNLVVLMGKVCGNTFTKDGEDLSSFSFAVGIGSSIFFSTIGSVRVVLCEIYPHIFMCLLSIEMLLLHIIVNKWLVPLFGLLFSSAMYLLMSLFLPALSTSCIRLHYGTFQLILLLWDLISKMVFTVKFYHLKLPSYSSFTIQSSS